MLYEITGKIVEIFNTQTLKNDFKKREFVIEKTDDNNGISYTNYLKFQLIKERTNLIDNFKINEEVKLYFFIKGTKWKNRDNVETYFTNLEAWKIESLYSSEPSNPKNNPSSLNTVKVENSERSSNFTDSPIDDLPF